MKWNWRHPAASPINVMMLTIGRERFRIKRQNGLYRVTRKAFPFDRTIAFDCSLKYAFEALRPIWGEVLAKRFSGVDR